MEWVKDGKEISLNLIHFELVIEKKSDKFNLLIWDKQLCDNFYECDLETDNLENAKLLAIKEYKSIINYELEKFQESISELNRKEIL